MASGLTSRSIVDSDLLSEQFPGDLWFVDKANTGAERSGTNFNGSLMKLQDTIDAASERDKILIAPYYVSHANTGLNESLTVSISKPGLEIVGAATRLATAVAPTATNP